MGEFLTKQAGSDRMSEAKLIVISEATIGVPTFFPPKIQASLGWLTAPISHRSAKKPPLVTL
jgi:hypothetical protein